ncbi:hypothetical protein HJG54_11245 [Leptolyngbya sp. NK1-12]|uniref:Uncharacterized protein n=1 Tax=Leptolyngbya sp. NK1-12 TaxID=2547451 RepID=A0AA97AK64_9CYAN|nr:hypothetical protein [Leptolyngbya sp. NK1-12]WNZ23372.1 hypothetical protein HJG54_11245 [Leptolyngbya sp. NK1-12]
MTNPQNLEPRVERLEIDMTELKQLVSDLRSTVATLADIVATHEAQHEESMRLHEESRQRFERFVEQANQDRALMLQLIRAIAQGRNGGD